MNRGRYSASYYGTIWVLGITLLVCLHIQPTEQLPATITIAGLFDKGDVKQEIAFRYAVDRVKAERVLGMDTTLNSIHEKIPIDNSFYASKRVCSAVRRSILAIFGPQSPKTSVHVQSICDALEIPHIETRWDFRTRRDDYSINLYPHPAVLSMAYLDIVRLFQWKSFCIIYEDHLGLVRLQDLLKIPRKKEFKICYKQLPRGNDFRYTLNEIKMIGEFNILLDCHTDKVFTVLKQAQQVGMMTDKHSFLLTTLDIHLVDMEDFRYSGANITALRIIDPERDAVKNLMADWQASRVMYTHKLNDTDIIMATETALMYDAVQLFVQAIIALDISNDVHLATKMDCLQENPWVHGNSLINYMKMVELHGLTGNIGFDSRGFRTDFVLDIVELQRNSIAKVGTWSRLNKANVSRSSAGQGQDILDGIANKTIRVSIALNDPYIMLAESAIRLTGNARYEGFCIDLLSEVAEKLKFNYILMPVEGNGYGSLDPILKIWTGMLGEIKAGRADMAMTDLTISHARQEAVDFTMPFMNLGISIMYVKPSKAPPKLFSFLSPLSIEVWIYMITAFFSVSLLMYILARFSPYEWQNPHPCNSDPDSLENQFTFSNCLWFSIGSLMQQGCDFLPQAVSTRMVAGMWWFFTLIMISSYTANLAAFLTVEQLEIQIESAEDLARQTRIKYGTKSSGTTKNFFKTNTMSPYKVMWNFMEQNPSVFVESNSAGVDRVKNDNGLYAYFMESTSIEYVTERECALTRVGGLLDSKSYGIAIAKNSPYKGAMDVALLTLQSEGRFHILKNKWFTQKRGGGKCREESGGGGGASELNLSNVGGVFVVLMSGMGLSLVIAIFEFSGECHNIAKEDEVPFLTVLKDELIFVFKCKGSSKPVRKKAEESEAGNAELYGSDDYNYTAKNPLT